MANDPELILGASNKTASGEAIEDVSTADFKEKVLDESAKRPVLVDFWAPWCGPCKQLAPLLEKVVKSSEGKVKLVKMNIDDHPQVAGQLGIKSIPAVIAFQRGQPVDGFMGAVPESQIKGFIERLVGPLGNAVAESLAAAGAALEAGNLDEALAEFQAAIEADDSSAEAFAGMARTLLRMGDAAGAAEFIESLTDEIQASAEVAGVKTELHLAQQAQGIGDLEGLKQRIAQDPKDHQARFDLAIGLNGAGEFDEAADQLLHIIRTAKGWNEDAARKQLLEFFEAWGLTSEHTNTARRKLSAALYS